MQEFLFCFHRQFNYQLITLHCIILALVICFVRLDVFQPLTWWGSTSEPCLYADLARARCYVLFGECGKGMVFMSKEQLFTVFGGYLRC